MGLQSLHAKCVHVLLFAITCSNALSVRIADKLLFVKMRSKILQTKGLIVVFVIMRGDALNANIAEKLLFVNIRENALHARSA